MAAPLSGYSAQQQAMLAEEVMYEDDADDDSIPNIQKITKQNNVHATFANANSMNINGLVLENITSSVYFRNTLMELHYYTEAIDEIWNSVSKSKVIWQGAVLVGWNSGS